MPERFDRLHCEKQLEIGPGASYLFEEPGTLEHVVRLNSDGSLDSTFNLSGPKPGLDDRPHGASMVGLVSPWA